MSDLHSLIARDHVTAAWFWVNSISTGPYSEVEEFDAVFIRQTGEFVGTGEPRRVTLYTRGITTAQEDSRRENSNRVIRPDLARVLAHMITDAHTASLYTGFREWAGDHRESGTTHRDVHNDFEDWTELSGLHRQLVGWLGYAYDEYVKAAAEYAAEH